MADENENPLEAIRERANSLGLEGDEYDDFVESRMRRAGFKRGPGEWITEDQDDRPRDDDGEPITRGEWRRMQRERRQKAVRSGAAKKVQPKPEEKPEKPVKKDSWWGDYED